MSSFWYRVACMLGLPHYLLGLTSRYSTLFYKMGRNSKSKKGFHQEKAPAIDAFGNRIETKPIDKKPEKKRNDSGSSHDKNQRIDDGSKKINEDSQNIRKPKINPQDTTKNAEETQQTEIRKRSIDRRDSLQGYSVAAPSSKVDEPEYPDKEKWTSRENESKSYSNSSRREYSRDDDRSKNFNKKDSQPRGGRSGTSTKSFWDDSEETEKPSRKNYRERTIDNYFDKKTGADASYKTSKRKHDSSDFIIEKKGDLFDAPEDYSLAHCVAEDMSMSAGIAVEFKKQFKKTGYLMELNKRTGEVAVLADKDRYIYYLVTKRLSSGKPTLQSLKKSLMAMAEHVKSNNVKKIAMPTIGCGLDRLDWGDVKNAIHDTFVDLGVSIVIYHYDKTSGPAANVSTPRSPFIKHIKSELTAVQSGTGLLYLVSDDGAITEEMIHLDKKHKFLDNYSGAESKLGRVIRTVTKNTNEVTYGLVCKRKDELLTIELEDCVINLNKLLLEDGYNHIAIQGVSPDSLRTHYVTNLLKHCINSKITIWVCWKDNVPLDFKECVDF